jgi:hypothetical protein
MKKYPLLLNKISNNFKLNLMQFKNLFLILSILIFIYGCQNSVDDNLIKNYEGTYYGYCIVGNIKGESIINIKNGKATVKYTVIINHNAEEIILGTGTKQTETESGTIKNIQITKKQNGTKELTGTWENDDKSLGSGSIIISLSDKIKNTVICSIFSSSAGWEYTAKREVLNDEFKPIINELCPDTNLYNTLLLNSNNNTNNYERQKEIQDSLDLQKEIDKIIEDSLANVNIECPNFFIITDKLNLDKEVKKFIQTFYNSLELTDEENREAFINGKAFTKTDWKKYLNNTVNYSKDKLNTLIGQYHDHYQINLLKINSIKIENNNLIVSTLVQYFIHETATFNNIEEIIFTNSQNKTFLKGWYDVEPKLVEKLVDDEFNSEELYKIIGSNKKN